MKQTVLNFSDQELIETLKRDTISSSAIQFLYRSHYPALSNYVRLNRGSEQDAEDIFQEVIVNFIEIVRKEKFRGEAGIGTFLYSLNRFTWLNELKRRNRALLREEVYDKKSGVDEKDVSQFLVERESKMLVLSLLEKLGDVCKQILTSFYYENKAMKEILQLVNFENEQVLRNKKYKCLKSLEQMLAANPGLAQRFKNALEYGQ
ncbi:sigma-70 family RNA polymerase sigma factor [Mucilaginibacter sp. BJC16-A38]|uniref:RNA polymerase sigma factor n=1 Tax=Mucilaginibacter phenanthrenivorans TaxID=1234842 RepID=UPI0021575BFA|nr:sigma-70 family RNA polymerase sigma factor [Mucilaginibacter phenanthrenivorans]MCR8557793.1 sigma-70 family RNA polymerase sigma factor [Mucilaginibacter phenanthrenivorans]